MGANLIENLNSILKIFKIKASCVNYQCNNNYFYYDLLLNSNTRVKDIHKFINEITLKLRSDALPIIKVMHSLGVVRLEFINKNKNILNLFDYFTNDNLPCGNLICLLGKSVDGNPVWMNLEDNPHMIVAGTTGSGKSVLLHNIIANLLNYNDVEINLIDPKQIEFCYYENKIKNIKVLSTYKDALIYFSSLIDKMNQRYTLIRNGYSVKNMKPIITIFDEFADLMAEDNNNILHNMLCSLSQKCRAARMYLILSTQRPSVNIINGVIKANFPARIACRVTNHFDSKVILDSIGAENLQGRGDALLKDNSRSLDRFQIAYTSAKEVCKYFGN
jgi:DNA segregation ATPase FtsK/SpoIIIE, S-DNA-T family